LPIFSYHADGESRIAAGAGLAIEIDIVHQHGGVALNVAFDIRGFVAMPPEAPDEYPEALEIEVVTAGDRGPKPDRLFEIAVRHLAEREVRHDAMAFGVLRHLVRDGHRKQAG